MTGISNAVQQAVYSALSNSSELADLLAEHIDVPGQPAIYDDVPQSGDTGNDANFPYVTLGEDTHNEWGTDTSSGAESTVTLHAWSRFNGRKEAKEILGAIYNALHRRELVTPEHNFIGCDFEYADTTMDPDGETRHGVIRFRLTLDVEGV